MSSFIFLLQRKQSKELDRHMSVLRKRKRLFMAHYGSRIFVSVLSQIFLTRNVAPFKATQASVPHRNQRAMPWTEVTMKTRTRGRSSMEREEIRYTAKG
ncbi:uncharacterized protein LOC131060791 isoform X2 [Cryptomeria japonica]|nr:uncharacterized protein LOC131060791 isoform X2 [Cryptomeria japonica]